jgi:gliding motility-associated-like protein
MKKSIIIGFLCFLFFSAYGQNCTLSVNISSTSPAICSGSAVTITAGASSGTPPYKYLWSTGETTASINVSRAGTFSVSVTDNTPGCKGLTQSITLTNSTTPATPVTADVSICPNSSATLTATAPGGFYQWYDAPSGGNLVGSGASYTTPVLTSSRTYYVETTINQCTSLRKAATVNVVSNINVNDAFICGGTTATLTAGGASTYQWYDAATGGNLVSSTATYTTPILNASTTYYVIGTGNGCVSNPTPVTAHVTPAPAAPLVPGINICSGTATTLSAPTQSGVVFNWYDVPTGGTSLITSPDFTTPVLTASKTYYVQAAANGCLSPRTRIDVTVSAIPPAPIATGVTICPGNSATITSTTDDGTHQWFATAASQAILYTGDVYQTPVLIHSRTYYVRSVNGSCVSGRTAVSVTVNPVLPPPSAAGQIICAGNITTLTARVQQGSIEWYDAPTDGNLISSGATYTTPILNATTTYYVQAAQSGCSSGRVAVQVTVLPLPQAPIAPDQTICEGSSATFTASGTGSSYQWYDAATGGNLLSGNQTFTTPALTATTTYYVQTISAGGCVSPRGAVTAMVTPAPISPTAAGVSICQGTKATLTANSATGSITWFDAASGGNQLATGNSFTTPVLSANTTYYVQTTNGQCTSTRTAVTVTINPVYDPQFQYSSGTYCFSAPNPTPTIYTPSGGTFGATPAGLVFANTTTGEINLSASALGDYLVSFTGNGACPVTSTTHVSISAAPKTQFLYNGPYCQKGSNPPPSFIAGGTAGTFSATPLGLVFTNTSTGQIDLGKSQAGTYTVTNTIAALGGCPASSFTAPVTIEQAPTVSAGPNQNVATGTTVQLAGSYSGATGVSWSGGAGTFSDPSSPTSTYTPANGEGTVNLTLTTTDPPGVCGPQSSTVTIRILIQPLPPTVANTSVCMGNGTTLTATAPGGTYQWYDATTGGNLLFTGAAFNTPALAATTIYYVQTTVNGVASSRIAVTVAVNNTSAPVAPAVSSCRGSSAVLSASGSTGTYQWYDAAVAGNLLSTTSTYTTALLIADTAYYVQSVLNGCISPRGKVAVKVNPIPTVTSSELADACSGSGVNYTITADVASGFIWSRAVVPGISNPAANNQTSTLINEALINTTKSTVDVTYTITPVANGCTGSPFTLVVTVYPPAVVSSPANELICNGQSPNYTIQFTTAPSSFTWSRAVVAGISNPAISNQAAPTIRELLNNTTNKPVNVKYAFTINTVSCAPYEFDYIVTVNPTASITSASSGSICSGIQQNYTITSNVDLVTYVWSRGLTGDISNPAVSNQTSNTITETLVNTSQHAVNVNYFITPYINGCPGNSINYRVTVNPQPAIPVINSNSPVCLNSTIKLNTVAVDGITYSWTGPNGFTSASQNPIIGNVTKANAGTYILTEIGSGCIGVTGSVNVAVDDPPIATAGANQTICTNAQAVNLNGIISGGTTTGVWASSGTGTFLPAINFLNAQYIPSDEDKTSGSVVLTLRSTSKDDCNIAISSLTVTIQQGPVANAGGNRNVCTQDVSVKLNSSARFANHVLWTTSGSGTFSPSDTVATPLYIQSAADIKNGSVILTIQAMSNICSNTTDQAVIKFIPPPTVNAGLDRFVIKGQTTTLNPRVSETDVHYLWTPNTYLKSDTVKDAVVTGSQDITYTLRVTDARGCVTEDQINIKALEPLNVPNTFTPNGDQINDLWNIPALNKYPGAVVDVYTRDGHQVFHSDGYGISWDGTYNGKPVPVGVYYYVIDTKYQDIKVSGPLTIIR